MQHKKNNYTIQLMQCVAFYRCENCTCGTESTPVSDDAKIMID